MTARFRWALPAAAAALSVAVALLWARALPASLWVDECVTYWVAADGPAHIFQRSLLVLQSPLHVFIAWAGMKITGTVEAGMRFPSVLAMAAAALLLYRLARRIGGAEFALLGVSFFLCSPFVAFFATDGRPYACALAASTGALEAFLLWKTGGRWRHALLFAVLSALTVHFQLLFVYAYAVFGAAWLLGGGLASRGRSAIGPGSTARSEGDRRAGFPSAAQLLAVGFTIALLLSPLALHFKTMFVERDAKSPGFPPTLATAWDFIAPRLNRFSLSWAVAAGALAMVIAAALGKRVRWRTLALDRSAVVLMVVAAVLPVAILFAAASLTGVQVFVPRYAILAAAPLALLFAWGVRALPAAFAWPAMAAFVAIQLFGFWRGPFLTLHGNEGWRQAAAFIQSLPESGPVLVRPGLAESASPRHLAGGRYASYLCVPLTAYPLPSKTAIPLPFYDAPELRDYLRGVYIRAALYGKFLILTNSRIAPGHATSGDPIRAVAAWANQDGFTVREAAAFGEVSVWEFRQAGHEHLPPYPATSPVLPSMADVLEPPLSASRTR